MQQETSTLSLDGQWAWNGTEWVPNTTNTTTPPPPSVAEAKPKRKRRGVKIGAGVLGVLIVLGIATSGGDDSPTDSTPQDSAAAPVEDKPAAEEPAPEGPAAEEPAAEVPAAEQPAPDAAAGIGDPVADGKFEFTVSKVKKGVDQVGSEYLNEEAQGSFTLVTMRIENIGDEPQTFSTSNLTGTDSKGREIAADSTASYYASDDADIWMSEINPGNSITVIAAFDLAKGETLDSIEVHDSIFSGGETIVLK